MLEIRRIIKNLGLKVAARLGLLFSLERKELGHPEAVYVLMLRPLGLGDLMMLSPFVLEIAARFQGVPVFLVTEYVPFMDMRGVAWMPPHQLDAAKRGRGLVISPTLSWRHVKYLRGAAWYLGYFLSNHIMSNFALQGGSYDARQKHYYLRTVEILNALDPWAPGEKACRYPSIVTEPVLSVDLPESYVCMAPVANWEERQYPLERYKQIAAHLAKHLPVVLIGGNAPMEFELVESLRQEGVINLVGKTSLNQAAEVIAHAKLFIGNDSGLAHVAFLVGTPSLVVFGCVPGELRIPLDSRLAANITVLGAGRECPLFPCYDGFNRPHCANDEPLICLRGVAAETVIENAEAVLNITRENSVSATERRML